MLHNFDSTQVVVRGYRARDFDFETLQDQDDMVSWVKEFWDSYSINFPENKKNSSFHDMLKAMGGEENFTYLWNKLSQRELVRN